MNQNRRFTRSSGSRYKNTHIRLTIPKEQTELMSKIEEIIANKNYNQALSIINSLQLRKHWVECKRALILFQMGKTPRSLNAVRNALKIQRRNCCRCYSLLLNIIQKSRPRLHPFIKDIENSLKCENLPKRIKTKFQILKSEIDEQAEQAEQSSVSQQRFQKLTQYYQNKGLLFKKIEIVEIQDQYRVARAKSLIKPNQVIIFVPEAQMITLQLAKSQQEVCKIAEQETRLKSPKHCMLSVFLLIHLEKGQESPYYNYIQCLPKRLNNFPIYYPDDLLQQLSGTYFLSIIKRKKTDIEEDYEEIISIIPQLKSIITYEKFTWARMIVSSRIFGVIINQIKTDALVPIADMLNHKIPKMTSWYFSDQKKGFIVQNGVDQIPKGQQIFDSYGSKCNSRFLLNYGFIIPNNSFNQVVIKVKRMRNNKINVPNVKLTTIINSDQFKNLMAYYRRTISQLNFKYSVHHDQQQGKSVNFISHQNQCQVWQLIHQTMKDQLKEYKTTIRTDQKILRSLEPLPENFRNCVEIRLGQKIVLDFYIRMSKKMIDYFSRKRCKIDVSEYEAYIREIAPLLRPSSL